MQNRKNYLFTFFFLCICYAGMSQPRQGMKAAEIALPSVSGDTMRLSSFKGKVILLDFWASWCLPCRASNKRLTKLYPKYKEMGFEIFAVSLDTDHSSWKKAVAKDKVNWPQVIDAGGWDAKTAISWNISALPTSYLIDKEGTLLAMDLEGKELEKALKHLLEK